MNGHASLSKVVALLVLAPFCALLYYASWYVLPMWRWTHVDFADLAKSSGIPENELRTEFDMVVFYNPRGHKANDPSPYQIVESTPTWRSLDTADLNEDTPPLLVRCTVISECDGQPISSVWHSVAPEENFFRIKAYRFPGGSFGMNPKRPVVVYEAFSMHKAGIDYGQVKKGQIATWETDDEMASRRDSFGR